MKRIIFLISIILHAYFLKAQVSINTNEAAPHNSAMLDISSSSKGLLIPRVALLSASDNTTILNPATSLLVYNLNAGMIKGVGFYFNSGTAANPFWQPLMDVMMPYYKAGNVATSAFSIDNYSPVASSSAILGNAGGSGIGVEGKATNGTGVHASSFSGYGLDVSGKVKIAGNNQSPAQGRVLTSDANGNATWEGAVAFSVNGVSSAVVHHNTSTRVPFAIENYDLGNNYNLGNPTQQSFIAPVNGIYHFDVHIIYFGSAVSSPTVFMKRKRNANEITIASYANEADETRSLELTLSKDVQLNAGDEIYIQTSQKSGYDCYLKQANDEISFSGRLVVRL